MRKLTINGKHVPLLPDAAITFDLSSNLLDLLSESNSSGSHSMPFTIPDTPEARLAFGDIQRIDNKADQAVSYPATFEETGFFLRGNFELRAYVPKSGFRGNLITSEKAIIKKLKDTKLRDLELGGTFTLGGTPQEIVDHMKTVSMRNYLDTYTFGPVFNPGLYESNEDYRIYKSQYINRWMPTRVEYPQNTEPQPYGPGFGTFYAICPFPSLHFVLAEAFAEIGLKVEENFFDDELKRLVILCNTSLDRITMDIWKEGTTNWDWLGANGGNTYEPGLYRFKNHFKQTFKIGEILPDLTLHQLLRKLQNTFGMMLTVSLDGSIKLSKVEPVLQNPHRIDLTGKFLANHEQEFTGKRGYRLQYRKESGDSIASEQIKDIDDLNYLGEVALLEDMYSQSNNANDCYFVRSEKAYYVYSEPDGWLGIQQFYRYAADYAAVKSADEASKFTMGIATTVDQIRSWNTVTEKYAVPGWPEMESITADPGDLRLNEAANQYFVYDQVWEEANEGEPTQDWIFFCENETADKQMKLAKWKVPAMDLTRNKTGPGKDNQELRLAFYRGMQPTEYQYQRYPMLSGDNYNMKGERIGEYTLNWQGADGIAEKFLKTWLKMIQGKKIRGTMAWQTQDLTQVDQERLYSLEGQKAIIKNIKFTLPLRKAPQVELLLF